MRNVLFYYLVPYLLNVSVGYHTSQYCFSPAGNKPNGNYFMENACAPFLFTSSKVAEEERVSEGNE